MPQSPVPPNDPAKCDTAQIIINVRYRQQWAFISSRLCCRAATMKKAASRAAFPNQVLIRFYSASLAAFFFGAAFFLGSSASPAASLALASAFFEEAFFAGFALVV